MINKVMETKLKEYNKLILDYLRSGKISSITLNNILYDDYKDIPDNIIIESIIINKKYIKLFDDEDFILKHYISDKERLVKNDKSGKYIKLKISKHAIYRYITRFIILILKESNIENRNIEVNNYITALKQYPLYPIIQEELIFPLSFYNQVNITIFKDLLNKFINKYDNLITEEIYLLFKTSKRIKKPNYIYIKRSHTHGDTNYFIKIPFLLIYDIDSSVIKTIEIFNDNNNGKYKNKYKQMLNKDARDYAKLLKMIHAYLLKNNYFPHWE